MHRRSLGSIAAFVCCIFLLVFRAGSVRAEASGLSWLSVANGIFSPVFTPAQQTYYVILENSIATFDAAGVDIRTADPEAEVDIVCLGELNEDGTLPEGQRVTWLITVKEPDGSASRYYLKLYRKVAYTAPVDPSHQLAQIVINGGTVEVPHFSGIKAYYEVSIPADVTELTIQAYPEDRSKMAVVINAPEIMPDEPVCVSILVKSSSGDENFSVYTLLLRREGFAQAKRFTGLQLLASGLAAFAAGVVAALLVCRRREVPHEAS